MRVPWNWLDIVVVVFGTMELIAPNGPNFSMFRAFRLLRVVSRVPKLSFLVTVIFKSMPQLMDVFGLCAFVLFVFGIVGVQVFGGGVLRGACYDMDSGAQLNTNWPCSVGEPVSNDPIQDEFYCTAGTQQCLPLNTPPYNTISFDNIVSALINIFQVFTQQGWTDVMYNLQACFSFQVWIYFVALNFIGPYFLVQLFLVVLAEKYSQLSSAAASVSASATSAAKVQGNIAVSHVQDVSEGPKELTGALSLIPEEPAQIPEAAALSVPEQMKLPGENGAKCMQSPFLTDADGEGNGSQKIAVCEDVNSGPSTEVQGPERFDESVHEDLDENHRDPEHRKVRSLFIIKAVRKIRGIIQTIATASLFEYFIRAVIVINTLFMAIDSDCDFCSQPSCATEKGVLEISNVVFTLIFTFEASVNLIAFGTYRYLWIMSPMSWLDVAIVASSLAETPSVLSTSSCYLNRGASCDSFDYCEGGGATSVLRVVRLLRILKLLSRFVSLQKQVLAIVKTFKSVAWLLLLICLFVLVFVILGMTQIAGLIDQPYSASNLVPGMRVYVQVPGDDIASLNLALLPTLNGRVATISGFPDYVNHSARPWYISNCIDIFLRIVTCVCRHVCFDYGVPPSLFHEVGSTNGCTWATVLGQNGLNTPGYHVRCL